MYKKILKFVGIATVTTGIALALVAGYHAYSIHKFANQPFNSNAGQVLFTIEPGQSLRAISIKLKNLSLVSDSKSFIRYARFKNAGTKLQAGDYLLSAADTPEKILKTLLSGKVKLFRITFPEGWNMYQIALELEKKGFCPDQEFIELCTSRPFIEKLGIKALSLEGYLFPDTYLFPKQAPCHQIVETMVKRFHTVFDETFRTRADEIGFTIHETVTLASIIEKETGDATERPLISSVFHNRLKKNMRLESDPTVIYGIENFDGNIKRRHLKELTPYNTYRIKGLPLGPIANPGKMSIKAALYPAQSDYLFFVSKKDTTHHFSRTIKEHNWAVRKYQLRRR